MKGINKLSFFIASLCVAGACQAQLANDVQAGKDLDFDLKSLNYTYTGFSAGSGAVTDEQAPPACVAKPAGQLNTTLSGAALGLPFNINIPLTGSIVNPTRLKWVTDSNPNVTVPVPVGTTTIDMLIRRVWGQMTVDASAEPLFRDLVCNQGYNVRMLDTNSNTDTWLNVEAYAFGIVSALFRVDFQIRDIDLIQFGGVPRGTVKATGFTIVTGTPFGGNVASLAASDDDKVFVLCDESISNSATEFVATSAGETPSSLTLKVESSATNPSLTQFVEAYNYVTSAFVPLGAATLTGSDVTRSYVMTNPGASLIQSGTCEIKARVRTIPFEDLETADGWSIQFDQVVWESLP